MKKTLIFALIFATTCSFFSAKAWNNLAHGTTAYIAEQHLTPEAKAKCHYYLKHTLPYYASWMDSWRSVAKFRSVNGSHSGYAMSDGVNYNLTGGKFPGGVMGHLVKALDELGDGKYKNLPDSIVRQRLINMVHYVGDMHCPCHVHFPKEAFPQYVYELTNKGKRLNFHTYWDSSLDRQGRGKWTYERLAAEIDTISPEQAQAWQSGTIEDWGRDCVKLGHRARAITTEGTDTSKMTTEQKEASIALTNDAIAMGAYRLAYVLNTIFSDKNIKIFNE
jgi:hypothetical protein